MPKYVLVIHGGAGTILKEKMLSNQENMYKDTLSATLEKGIDILKKGGTSLDAIEVAVNMMEDAPLFNAGKGSVFTNQGKNEMDASIMEGQTLNAGAVAAVTNIKNPITAARKVMESSPHVMLNGRGAELFAKEQKLEIVDAKYFFDERRWKQFQKVKDLGFQQLEHDDNSYLSVSNTMDDKFGTVGAVALDSYGNLAAGTSTGGITNKQFGRVGDSPIIGAGTYANNNTCAVSATGHGEYFIRGIVAYDVSALMEYQGMSLEEATEEVIMVKQVKLGGSGGLIAVDKLGNIAMPFNTPGMYRGYIKASGEKNTFIFKEDAF